MSHSSLKILFLLVLLSSCVKADEQCQGEEPGDSSCAMTVKAGLIGHPTLKNNRIYDLVVLTIFKNEESYLQEWLDSFIFDHGFHHAYLYANQEDLSGYPYLQDPKYSQHITLIPWADQTPEGIRVQYHAFAHYVRTYSHLTNFCLIVDSDEFIDLYKDKDKYTRVIDYFQSLEPDWMNIIEIRLPHYNFGSNGRKTKPKMPVQQAYKKHQKECFQVNPIGNMNYVDLNVVGVSPHSFSYNEELLNNLKKTNDKLRILNDIDETDETKRMYCSKINETSMILKHYKFKSFEEYMIRCKMWLENGNFVFPGQKNRVRWEDCSTMDYKKFKKMEKDVKSNEIVGFDYLLEKGEKQKQKQKRKGK